MSVVEYVLFDMDGLLLYVTVFSSQKSVIDAIGDYRDSERVYTDTISLWQIL
jgi:hypothetical protein